MARKTDIDLAFNGLSESKVRTEFWIITLFVP